MEEIKTEEAQIFQDFPPSHVEHEEGIEDIFGAREEPP